MKVFHINSYYAAGKFYKGLYDAQHAAGIGLTVSIPTSQSAVKSEFDYGEFSHLDACFKHVDRYLFFPKHLKIIGALKRRYDIAKYQVLHAHSMLSNGFVAWRLSKIYNKPFVVAVRSSDLNSFMKVPLLRDLGRKIIEDAAAVIFLSESYEERFIGNHLSASLGDRVRNKSFIIPNGISSFWFDNIGISKRYEEKHQLKLIQVGELIDRKNVRTTLKAVDALNRNGVRTVLNVVGKPTDRAIHKQVMESPFAQYRGFLEKEELLRQYRKNDIFVLPSLAETFGLVYAEAMSQGLPVIYTKNEGFDQQFPDGDVGYAIHSTSVDDIVKRVMDVVKNYSAISEKCVKGVQKFNWDRIAREYDSVYNFSLVQ